MRPGAHRVKIEIDARQLAYARTLAKEKLKVAESGAERNYNLWRGEIRRLKRLLIALGGTRNG